MYVYIYIYMCMYTGSGRVHDGRLLRVCRPRHEDGLQARTSVYICIYIYIERERYTEREREMV